MLSAHIKRPDQTEVQRIARANLERHLSPAFVGSETVAAAPRAAVIYCSQCGGEFPDAKGGLSSCDNHAGMLDHSRIDAEYLKHKLSDAFGQRAADRTSLLEMRLREATGQVF